MYRIRKSIDVDFSHHVRGHLGPCINLHGHTWKLEVAVEASTLSAEGFVVDFKHLKQRVLAPCHALLDHALAVGEATYAEVAEDLAQVGKRLLASREAVHGEVEGTSPPAEGRALQGAVNRYPGGMKVAVFPFNPTSERLAAWLYRLADATLADGRVRIGYARIYETLHPVESMAQYWPADARPPAPEGS